MDTELKARFMKLPIVEQQRLLHLAEWIAKGRALSPSLLKGFPLESIRIMDEMLQAKMETIKR